MKKTYGTASLPKPWTRASRLNFERHADIDRGTELPETPSSAYKAADSKASSELKHAKSRAEDSSLFAFGGHASMSETGEQRRRFFRRRMLKGARIVFGNGSSIFTCRVRDISEGGARLEIGNTLGIPDEFTLTMEDGTASYSCRVRRRTLTALEVEFVVH